MVTKGGFDTDAEATKAMRRPLVAADDGMPVRRNPLQLGVYLDDWMARASPKPKPTTTGGYARAIVRIGEQLGKARVHERATIQIEEIYFDPVKEGLSPGMIRDTHSVLRRALADAERLGLVLRTASAAARPPSVPHHEQRLGAQRSPTRSWPGFRIIGCWPRWWCSRRPAYVVGRCWGWDGPTSTLTPESCR